MRDEGSPTEGKEEEEQSEKWMEALKAPSMGPGHNRVASRRTWWGSMVSQLDPWTGGSRLQDLRASPSRK